MVDSEVLKKMNREKITALCALTGIGKGKLADLSYDMMAEVACTSWDGKRAKPKVGEVLKYLLQRIEQRKAEGKFIVQQNNDPVAVDCEEVMSDTTAKVITVEVQQQFDKLFAGYSKMHPISRADVDRWELAMLSFTKEELMQLLQAENVPVLAVGTAYAIVQELKIGRCDTLNRIKERLFGKGQSR